MGAIFDEGKLRTRISEIAWRKCLKKKVPVFIALYSSFLSTRANINLFDFLSLWTHKKYTLGYV